MKKLIYILFLFCSFAQSQTLEQFEIIRQSQIPEASATEFYDWSDAANATSEANTYRVYDTKGWGELAVNCTIAVSLVEFQSGSYSIELTATADATNNYTTVSFEGLTIGQNYRFTFWYKGDGNGTKWLRGASGWVTNPSNTILGNTTWTEHSFDLEASATTANFQFWPSRFDAGSTGFKLWLDSISLITI